MSSIKRETTTCTVSASTVILDIEGTTTSISFVKDVLFPYIRNNLEEYLNKNWDSDEVQESIKALKTQAQQDVENKVEGVITIPEEGEKDALKTALIENIKWQMDNDRKTKSLKDLQGLIMEKGYKAADIKGHVYDDVERSLKSWLEQDKSIYIYSSGSIHAQKLLFGYSEKGDILPLIKGHFDTSVGMKGDPNSYKEILKQISTSPSETAFFTDVPTEAKAAKQAGIVAILVSREGNAPLSDQDKTEFQVISSFEDVEFTNSCKKMKICSENPVIVHNKNIENCSLSFEDRDKPDPSHIQNGIESKTPSNNKKSINTFGNSDEMMEVDDITTEQISTASNTIANGHTNQESSSVENNKQESTESKKKESAENNDEESTESSNKKELLDNKKDESTESKEESSNGKKKESTESLKEESGKSKEEPIESSLKEIPIETMKDESTENIEKESIQTKREESNKNNVENESTECNIKNESIKSKEEESTEINIENESIKSKGEESTESNMENESIKSKGEESAESNMENESIKSKGGESTESNMENESIKSKGDESTESNMENESIKSKEEESTESNMENESIKSKGEETTESSIKINSIEILKEEPAESKKDCLLKSKEEVLVEGIKDKSSENKTEEAHVTKTENMKEEGSTDSKNEDSTGNNMDKSAEQKKEKSTVGKKEEAIKCLDEEEPIEIKKLESPETKEEKLAESKIKVSTESITEQTTKKMEEESLNAENQERILTEKDKTYSINPEDKLEENNELQCNDNHVSHVDTSLNSVEEKQHNENSDENTTSKLPACEKVVKKTNIEESQKDSKSPTSDLEESNKKNLSKVCSDVENKSCPDTNGKNLITNSQNGQMVNGENKTTNGFSSSDVIKDNGCSQDVPLETKKHNNPDSTAVETVVED